MVYRTRSAAVFLPAFAILSLLAVALGCLVAQASGTPASIWGRNLAVWAAGGLLAAGLARGVGGRALFVWIAAAPVALCASLFARGQEGVHRWLDVGPIHMNAAEVLLPAAVVAFAVLAASRWAWLAAVLGLGLLVLQPDASQAIALAGGMLAVVAASRLRGVWRGLAITLVALAVVAAWGRPDPLAPVPDVEGIMALAWARSPALAVIAWAALAGVALTPALLYADEAGRVRVAAFALTLYALGTVATPLLGAFPVPLVGMGMSPILGLWLGAGLLAGLARRAQTAAAP